MFVDADTIDQNYAQLEQQGQQTGALIQALAAKMQTAAAAGDQNAREWVLDLKEITLGVQQEQNQTTLLLESIHAMVGSQVQSQTQYPQAQPQFPQQTGGGGGSFQRFLTGGFGRSIMSGAGFGIGNDLVRSIF